MAFLVKKKQNFWLKSALCALGVAGALGFGAGAARAAKVPLVVAAENTWGDIAAQIAAPDMRVVAILSSPTVDPHEYQATPTDARMIAAAELVVANGAGYDTWADKLVAASGLLPARYVKADSWSPWQEGGNPHLWFNVDAVSAFVKHFAEACAHIDPEHADGYAGRAEKMQLAIQSIQAHAGLLKAHVAGMHVAATEPLFTPLADLLGLQMDEQAYQLAVMNDVEPAPSTVATFESDLKDRRLKMLVYNQQVEEPSVRHLLELAQQSNVPTLPLSEMLPPHKHWQVWVHDILTQVGQLLGVQQ
ncbi:metal ABC transporter solute-binding protein, Zn/Mn family [Acetobacter sp. LMG 32666]|uniref:metal ABC transporter solute-binding protein, Zn/Mn family n=1 Tax=Acetobacter sp. LMG 32666 TaxID=2959295 RepID=UPI0030C809D3